jgi:hypothetical protein
MTPISVLKSLNLTFTSKCSYQINTSEAFAEDKDNRNVQPTIFSLHQGSISIPDHVPLLFLIYKAQMNLFMYLIKYVSLCEDAASFKPRH